jgi:hypothetical protein
MPIPVNMLQKLPCYILQPILKRKGWLVIGGIEVVGREELSGST